jgi:hypothetical protein
MIGRWSALALAAAMMVAGIGGAACGHGNDSAAGADSGPGTTDAGGDGGNLFGGDAAQALVVQPQGAMLVVNGPGVTQQFHAYVNGSTTPAASVQWTVDVAAIGSIDSTGLFTATGLVGGQVTIAASVGSLQGQTLLTVVLQLQDNPGNIPPGTQQQLLGGGTADPAFAWLYPYSGTVFPRGLLPPTLQFAGTAPDAVLVQVSFSSLQYQGFYGASNPGQVALSPQLWTTITQTASGSDTVKVQLTKISGGQVSGPITESWTIAQGTLKGTVYYESRYSTPTDNGATMRIRPGAAQPDVLLGNCNVCHYVSADGSTIVATLDTGVPITSGAYDLGNDAGVLSLKPDETYTFGALYKDGSFLMSCGSATIPGIGNDGPVVSHLYDTKSGAQIPAAGWDGVITNGAMPTFSPDGNHIVFNHFDTGQGHTLALMDFAPSTYTFSNLADLVTDPSHYLGWPAFTPDSNWIVYDADNRTDFATWSAVTSGTGVDAKSDLQIAQISSMTTASLDSLNGLLNGQYYLPFGETAEGHMNYDATVLPVAVGGYYWVVFTSRREYGNTINTPDPYYNTPSTTAGALPWRKKLWVAALDIDNPEHPSTSAHDISHPAFYLPGQDLQTGNYRGFWALDPCAANGNVCESGDECCSGYCRQTTEDGGMVLACVPPQGCANEYEKCSTSADCCQAAQGYQCINGFCAQPSAQ